MAFAGRLGLPPHLNFMLVAVWLVALGIAWWRSATPISVRPAPSSP
jgi:hypothetical protein